MTYTAVLWACTDVACGQYRYLLPEDEAPRCAAQRTPAIHSYFAVCGRTMYMVGEFELQTDLGGHLGGQNGSSGPACLPR